MTNDIDISAVRGALITAFAGDIRRARRTHRRVRLAAVTAIAALSCTAAAAATGVIFASPKVDNTVPTVAEWTYNAHNPFVADSGPVLLRRHAASLAATNTTVQKALAARGVTARCGNDPGHPLACYLPSGDPVDGATLMAAMTLPNGRLIDEPGAGDYDIRSLTPSQAHAWLCAHPTQRPGADGGEKPAPTAGYEDC